MKRKPARSFQDLDVWKKAHAFVLAIYRKTASFPNEEIYGLTSQLRRASVSIPANIAEGFKRRTKPDKIRVLNISQSSLEEARYYLILSRDLEYLEDVSLLDQIDEVSRMLAAYIRGISGRTA